jgi:hypothetical protein
LRFNIRKAGNGYSHLGGDHFPIVVEVHPVVALGRRAFRNCDNHVVVSRCRSTTSRVAKLTAVVVGDLRDRAHTKYQSRHFLPAIEAIEAEDELTSPPLYTLYLFSIAMAEW